MPRRPPNCYIIAGPNGAGKTTFATRFLPIYADFEPPRLVFRDEAGRTTVSDAGLYEGLRGKCES